MMTTIRLGAGRELVRIAISSAEGGDHPWWQVGRSRAPKRSGGLTSGAFVARMLRLRLCTIAHCVAQSRGVASHFPKQTIEFLFRDAVAFASERDELDRLVRGLQ